MAESSISVAIRVRPFSAKESAQLAPKDDYQPFLGDGGLSAGSTSKVVHGTGPGLRTKYLRSIVSPVDDKVLIFDPPEVRTSVTSSGQNTFAHGTRKPRDIRYAFDRVLDDTCSQETVFEKTTKPLLDGILNGFNASVFAYGATGCGKTHTISGTAEDPGLIFLTMRELYKRIEDSKDDFEVNVRLSYLEIYNEQIRDLLSPTPTPPGSGLMLREDATNKISVMGITEHTPESPEGVLQMIHEGNQRRTMSPTEANAVSSRSHAVLQINVMQRPRTADTIMETTSASLNIIDLAGSERAAATRNNGARMKEGANINKSLLALGNCINALCQSAGQKNRHIPYRNSKLTRLLKFSLGGNCKTVMIVCVSPSSAHYDETYNTLKYANQAKNIRTKVSRNMLNVDRHVAQYVQAIHALKEEVAELKAKLADRAAVESAGEKRRKVEMAREMEEVKMRMQTSTSDMKTVIAQKAGLQGLLLAANVRLTALRQRMQQLEAESGGHNVPAADVECEKQVLRKLIGRQEAILSDRTMQGEAQNLVNSLQAHRAVLLAASNNVRFDEEATRSMRVIGDQLNAELEMCKTQAISEAFSKQLAAGMALLADFAVLGSRSTMALKEAAMEIGTQSASSEEQRGILVEQMNAVAKMNDVLFSSHIGMQTIEFAAPPAKGVAAAKEPRPSVLRRARSSVAAQVQASSAPSVAMAASARLSKRQSRSSLMQNTSVVGNSLLSSKAPRRPSNPMRRSSVGIRRISSASRKSVQSSASTPSSAEAPGAISAAKKAFRWADEAGEGKIDDKSSSSVEVTLPKARTSNGPSQSIRTSLGLQSSAAPSATEASQSVSNSSAEWEDVSKEVGKAVLAATVDGRSPLASSTSAVNTNSGSTTEATNAVKSKKRETQGSIFERNFLRKKLSSTSEIRPRSSDEGDEMDTDDSLLGIGDDLTSKPDDSINSCPSKPLAANAAARSSPYRRPSATLFEAAKNGALGNGVGPIRNKGRGSGSLDSPTRRSVASLAASINSRALPASRPTGNASNTDRP
jgi:kinesin family protein 18/19